MAETPVPTDAGLSRGRDRMWGLVGGVLGVSVGVVSAAIAVFVEGADPWSSVPYPAFFAKRQLLPYDAFVLVVIAIGGMFGLAAILNARRSPFPRTDTLGPMIASTILLLLGAAVLFMRVVALVGAP